MSRTAARSRARWIPILGVLLLTGISGRCDRAETAAPWPEGAWLYADRASLSSVLTRFEQLDGTPLARWSRGTGSALPACARVESHAASGRFSDLWSTLRCAKADQASWPAGAFDHDVAIGVPAPGGHVVALASVAADGRVDVDLSVPSGAVAGALELALPGVAAPGDPVLSGSETLLHARVRPAGGLDLAAFVPVHSQGAEMFRLKSELFAGTVLDGVWELAVYLPEEGRSMPRIALAMGFELRSPAVAAMDSFVDDLEQTWPVKRSPFRIAGAEGACLLDLKLMPDLAPCYVATESQLVIGWNPASVRKASDGGTGAYHAESALDGRGGAVVDLARFERADRILSRALSTRTATPAAGYPWSRVVASGAASDAGYRLSVRMSAASADAAVADRDATPGAGS
jgi:hypothetical protein